MWLQFRQYYCFLFRRRLARWDYSFRFRIRGSTYQKAALTFRIVFSFQRLRLINFLHAHVTSSDSEIRGIEMLFLFSVRTASTITCGLFLHAQSSMNFNTNQFRVMNCDDILTAPKIQLLFKSQNGSAPNVAVKYDAVLNF